jgi:hypothetical protein
VLRGTTVRTTITDSMSQATIRLKFCSSISVPWAAVNGDPACLVCGQRLGLQCLASFSREYTQTRAFRWCHGRHSRRNGEAESRF